MVETPGATVLDFFGPKLDSMNQASGFPQKEPSRSEIVSFCKSKMVSHNPSHRLQPERHNILCGLKPIPQKLTNALREVSRIAMNRAIHLSFQVPVEVCFNSAILSRSERATLIRGKASLKSSTGRVFVSKYSALRDCIFAFKVPTFPRWRSILVGRLETSKKTIRC